MVKCFYHGWRDAYKKHYWEEFKAKPQQAFLKLRYGN